MLAFPQTNKPISYETGERTEYVSMMHHTHDRSGQSSYPQPSMSLPRKKHPSIHQFQPNRTVPANAPCQLLIWEVPGGKHDVLPYYSCNRVSALAYPESSAWTAAVSPSTQLLNADTNLLAKWKVHRRQLP